MNYEWTSAMVREISGYHGQYEVSCRLALLAALRWLDEEPQRFKHRVFKPCGYEPAPGGIFLAASAHDVPQLLNNDAKILLPVCNEALDREGLDVLSIAMFSSVCRLIRIIRENGWPWFVAEMSRPKAKGSSRVDPS